ncbi:MAG: hypothetical protein Q8907_06735 [Bacteroidota bacterium]|nr:hypothetical protein [Bacteroidota bacterium]
MKKSKKIFSIIFCFACISLSLVSCGKYEAPVVSTDPVNLEGVQDTYASLNENSYLKIPVKFTSSCDSGLLTANYKVVNKRASDLNLVFGPAISLPIHGNSIDTTLNIPVRKGLMAVVISIYDKSGKLSCKTINVQNVVASDQNVKTLTNVVMSTDPADNQCFFSLYEAIPVFGQNVALTKQNRIDFFIANMGGAKPVSCNAYGASSSYYSSSLPYLTGFTTLTYSLLTASKSYITSDAFNAITKESDLNKFIDSTVIAAAPKGNNYNVMNADRRVGDAFNETAVNKGFILGWGYHTVPTASATSVLNESFALIMIRSVTKKANGHYVITFDVKAPVADQRADYNACSISPYAPYPL